MKMIRRLEFSSVSVFALLFFGCSSGSGGASGPVSGTGGAGLGTGGGAPGAGGGPPNTGGILRHRGRGTRRDRRYRCGSWWRPGRRAWDGRGQWWRRGRRTWDGLFEPARHHRLRRAGPLFRRQDVHERGAERQLPMFRPDASLGKNGFLHPVATWGNGITTTPDEYNRTLSLVASHGFVIIACNDTMAERPCLNAGMEWLVQQNTADGPLKGKLDTGREVAIGYSWGGGAAIDVSDRPNMKAIVSLHGMPPRVTTAFEMMHSPLLLFTSTGDMFVTAAKYVTPNYESSKVQTFYATLKDDSAGHLYPVDMGAAICVGAILGATFGACGDSAQNMLRPSLGCATGPAAIKAQRSSSTVRTARCAGRVPGPRSSASPKTSGNDRSWHHHSRAPSRSPRRSRSSTPARSTRRHDGLVRVVAAHREPGVG